MRKTGKYKGIHNCRGAPTIPAVKMTHTLYTSLCQSGRPSAFTDWESESPCAEGGSCVPGLGTTVALDGWSGQGRHTRVQQTYSLSWLRPAHRDAPSHIRGFPRKWAAAAGTPWRERPLTGQAYDSVRTKSKYSLALFKGLTMSVTNKHQTAF